MSAPPPHPPAAAPAATSPAAASPLAGRRLMLLASTCFIANVLLIRALGPGGAGVWMITALRFAAGLGLCLAWHRRELDWRALATKPRLIGRGLAGGVVTYGLYLTIVELGAGRAIFLNNLYVLLSALLAVWMLGERYRPTLALGGAAAIGGLGLLTGAVFGDWGLGFYEGFALFMALGSAWIVVTIRQLHHEGVPSPTIFAAQCIYGLLICAPPALAHGRWPSAAVLAGLLLAGLSAAFGQLAMTRAYRELSVAEGSLLQTLVPLGTAVGGILLFGEPLRAADLLGGALIVAGSVLPLAAPAVLARARAGR